MDFEEAEELSTCIVKIVAKRGTVAVHVTGVTDEAYQKLSESWSKLGVEVVWLKPGIDAHSQDALYFRRAHA